MRRRYRWKSPEYFPRSCNSPIVAPAGPSPIFGSHLQKQDAFRRLNPAGGNRFTELQECGDGLLNGAGDGIAPVEQLVCEHLSKTAFHRDLSFLCGFVDGLTVGYGRSLNVRNHMRASDTINPKIKIAKAARKIG